MTAWHSFIFDFIFYMRADNVTIKPKKPETLEQLRRMKSETTGQFRISFRSSPN